MMSTQIALRYINRALQIPRTGAQFRHTCGVRCRTYLHSSIFTTTQYDLSTVGGPASVTLPCAQSITICVNNATVVAANLSLPCTGAVNDVVKCFRPEFLNPATNCTTLLCPIADGFFGHKRMSLSDGKRLKILRRRCATLPCHCCA